MSNTNQMILQGKDVGLQDISLTINLASDSMEVRGFGQPITKNRAKKMAEAYFRDIDEIVDFITAIEESGVRNLTDHPSFATLKSFVDPSMQTVSGVFGKEIILQILAMSHCEGIRYIIGKDEDNQKNTVILIGVTDDGIEIDENGLERAKSVPVKIKTEVPNNVAVNGEVHNASLNIMQTQRLVQKMNFTDDPEGRAEILFGSY